MSGETHCGDLCPIPHLIAEVQGSKHIAGSAAFPPPCPHQCPSAFRLCASSPHPMPGSLEGSILRRGASCLSFASFLYFKPLFNQAVKKQELWGLRALAGREAGGTGVGGKLLSGQEEACILEWRHPRGPEEHIAQRGTSGLAGSEAGSISAPLPALPLSLRLSLPCTCPGRAARSGCAGEQKTVFGACVCARKCVCLRVRGAPPRRPVRSAPGPASPRPRPPRGRSRPLPSPPSPPGGSGGGGRGQRGGGSRGWRRSAARQRRERGRGSPAPWAGVAERRRAAGPAGGSRPRPAPAEPGMN